VKRGEVVSPEPEESEESCAEQPRGKENTQVVPCRALLDAPGRDAVRSICKKGGRFTVEINAARRFKAAEVLLKEKESAVGDRPKEATSTSKAPEKNWKIEEVEASFLIDGVCQREKGNTTAKEKKLLRGKRCRESAKRT